jgi:hypothetical protein
VDSHSGLFPSAPSAPSTASGAMPFIPSAACWLGAQRLEPIPTDLASAGGRHGSRRRIPDGSQRRARRDVRLMGRDLTHRGELQQLELAVLSGVRRCSVGVVALVLARDVRGETLGGVERRGGSRASQHQERIAQVAIIAETTGETEFCDLCEYCDGLHDPIRALPVRELSTSGWMQRRGQIARDTRKRVLVGRKATVNPLHVRDRLGVVHEKGAVAGNVGVSQGWVRQLRSELVGVPA